MEAIIRTNDRTLFDALMHFLKTLHISVETKEEIKPIQISKNKNDFNEAVKFWRSQKVNMIDFKFNREDAYDR